MNDFRLTSARNCGNCRNLTLTTGKNDRATGMDFMCRQMPNTKFPTRRAAGEYTCNLWETDRGVPVLVEKGEAEIKPIQTLFDTQLARDVLDAIHVIRQILDILMAKPMPESVQGVLRGKNRQLDEILDRIIAYAAPELPEEES